MGEELDGSGEGNGSGELDDKVESNDTTMGTAIEKPIIIATTIKLIKVKFTPALKKQDSEEYKQLATAFKENVSN